MRLTITGAAKSGKSTALRRLRDTALQATWAHILIADGRTARLGQAGPGERLRVRTNAAPEDVIAALTAAADRISARHSTSQHSADQQRELIVIDDVHLYTQAKAAKNAITTICENAGPSDVIIVASQREVGAIPPAARENINTRLVTLGDGYFQLTAIGQPRRQGRVSAAAPLAAADTLTPADLHNALQVRERRREPTLVTRYEGPAGSGRTYALNHHQPERTDLRIVFLDVRRLTHRELLTECLDRCGAAKPNDATIPDLLDIATIALQSKPTLLLLDNTDAASVKCRDTLAALLDSATEAAISALPPPAGRDRRDPIAAIRRRGHLVELEPISDKRANTLIKRRAPHLDTASRKTIVQQARGNPQALMAYCERVSTHGEDERHQLEGLKPPARWLNILVILCVLVGVILVQRHIANDTAGAILYGVLVLVMWYLRPIFRDMTRGGGGG